MFNTSYFSFFIKIKMCFIYVMRTDINKLWMTYASSICVAMAAAAWLIFTDHSRNSRTESFAGWPGRGRGTWLPFSARIHALSRRSSCFLSISNLAASNEGLGSTLSMVNIACAILWLVLSLAQCVFCL